MARRSIVFLCCVTAEFLCHSIDVCDTVTLETSASGRTLGVKSKYDIRHGFAPAFQVKFFFGRNSHQAFMMTISYVLR
jgi:hypothetical protein